MVFAEHLVEHRDECLDTFLVGDGPQLHARRWWHVQREIGDLGDEQGLGRLARETGGEQPVGEVRRLVV